MSWCLLTCSTKLPVLLTTHLWVTQQLATLRRYRWWCFVRQSERCDWQCPSKKTNDTKFVSLMNILGSNLCVKNCLTLKIMEPLRGSKSWRNPACELKKIPWVRGSKTRPVGITDSFFDSPSSRPRIGSCLTNPPKMARLILLVESIIRIAMGGGGIKFYHLNLFCSLLKVWSLPLSEWDVATQMLSGAFTMNLIVEPIRGRNCLCLPSSRHLTITFSDPPL